VRTHLPKDFFSARKLPHTLTEPRISAQRRSKMSSQKLYSPQSGSIGAQIYRGKSVEEVNQINPFANQGWLENDTAEFSDMRRKAVDALFENGDEISKAEIVKRTGNRGRYAAFRAIAHDVAIWDEERQVLGKIK
jgi:hypothetical protein